ncbi:sensor histidine kinase [Pseudonocardia sp. HH130630-07]|uniref:sensor histidine kinase n=1 Tax=Pseudonocardia sp. HH130630-07 TaxID=1690815 RepID=UPI000814DB2C|nr:histidine kinase [Pseudonocardia sp. HH130630-07]ANY06347.1 histidine kinase [Pseudonocardia sp. HH130630-07]
MTTAAGTGRQRWLPRVHDVLLVFVPLVIGLLGLRIRVNLTAALPPWLLYVDIAAGAVGCLALWWRRRFPVQVAALIIVLSTFAESVATAAMAALFTVAIHRSVRTTAIVAVATLAAVSIFYVLRPETSVPAWAMTLLVGSLFAATIAWGLLLRSRRQLIASLQERATMAEIEAELRAERTQHEARETLAREMHDVLGHRLSLLSVHAGALAYYRDATPEETSRAADVIRENAHGALQDLREVIGVLRAPVGEMPLPGVGDIGELLDETRRAGTPVTLDDEHGVTAGDRLVTDTVGRTLYRFLQESLTNARKHAPEAPIAVRITGEPGDRLDAEVENRAPVRPSEAFERPPGSGEGLRGLAERATLVGGHLDHGPTAAGGWRVAIRLPW